MQYPVKDTCFSDINETCIPLFVYPDDKLLTFG
ncbi:hypothetical protein SAMN05421747_102257 [Parapedobacter composti]|uniref:Uncharacterized protein n=1 Tax=Parapedobacter composti TaxID=623281 RepID=A0A1I1F6H0_9SPHI|nr:hypothetical protein SAMN05421747_102257 [Parapedobacter composti]